MRIGTYGQNTGRRSTPKDTTRKASLSVVKGKAVPETQAAFLLTFRDHLSLEMRS